MIQIGLVLSLRAQRSPDRVNVPSIGGVEKLTRTGARPPRGPLAHAPSANEFHGASEFRDLGTARANPAVS
jgi:hypothetical protein